MSDLYGVRQHQIRGFSAHAGRLHAGVEQRREPVDQGTPIPDALLAQVAPLPWRHIALTDDYLWNEIDRPLERYLPIRANRFNFKNFIFP